MDIYGLVGKSGTGKSYQALNVSRERGIPCIIDDGLFIGQNRVYGGKSAKREKTKLGAVKTAIFTEESHKLQVMEAIKEVNPESILILGTSDRMIYRIAERLELPEPKELIQIESISSEDDIKEAQLQRQANGKHAIPVATFQLKREFSGYFLRPLKILRRVGARDTVVAEKSEVRPTYSYLGKYIISERAVYDVINCVLNKYPEIKKVTESDIVKLDQGVEIYVSMIMKYGIRIRFTAELIQQQLIRELEELTGFHITGVNLTVKGLE